MIPPKNAREVYLGPDGEPIAWCPVDSLGITDIERGLLYDAQKERLAELQVRARAKPTATVVVTIDVDDQRWQPLVERLMPGHDWDAYRKRNEKPIARGLVHREPMEQLVAEFYPAAGELGPGCPILVFGAGGVLIVQDRS